MNYQILLKSILLATLIIGAPNKINSEDPQQFFEESKIDKNEIKILTWNIFMLPHCNILNGNKRRADQIADKLMKSDYDILLFEEAFDYRARRILREKLFSKFPFIYGPANESYFSLRTNSGLWVLSKIPLTVLKEIEYKSRFGIDAMARKGAVMFEGRWKNQNFQILVTHLQADSPDEIRRKQCNEIASELLRKFSRENVPQFVCGDFNIEMDDTENYNYMLSTLNAENGILEGNLSVSYDEIENTLAKKENGKRRLIDYFLLRNHEGKINKIKRSISVIKGSDGYKLIDLSDHYGIEALISFTAGDK